jgi:hypothetical protein
MAMNDSLAVLTVIAVVVILLLLQWRRVRRGIVPGLRPHRAYQSLQQQMGRSVESGQRLHITPGRGELQSPQGPASVAGLGALAEVAAESSESGIAPLISVGAGTLLPAAQGAVRRAYEAAGRGATYQPGDTQFLADRAFPFVYAAGATLLANQADVGSNVALGHFGSELGVLAEAGQRRDPEQILGSDDPTASAIAAAFTANAVWGEELFAARAYLGRAPLQLASLRTQDILRWLVAILVLVAAVLGALGILG